MRRWPLLLLLPLLLVACETPVALIPTPTAPAITVTPQVVRVACPDSLEPALRALASAYQRQVPATQFVILPRADTLALQALSMGDVDLVALTWLPGSNAEDVWRAPFARDGLAVVVHPQNGLPGITLEQLRELFQGHVEDWASWGGLPGAPQIISRERASGAFAFFQVRVMGDARVSLTGLLAPTSDAVLQLVDEDALAVGYVSTAWLDGRVRALAIEGVPPAQETIEAGVYPLARTLELATIGEPQGPTRDFIQWILGPEGQNVLVAQRLFPAP